MRPSCHSPCTILFRSVQPVSAARIELSRLVCLLFLAAPNLVLAAEPRPDAPATAPSILDWPQFLGPRGDGHADPRCEIPLKWNTRTNILWRTPIPGRGWSSPTVSGQSIWLTTAVDANQSLQLVKLDRQTGRMVWSREIIRTDTPGKIHPKNTHATPTPIIDGDTLYLHFGTHGTARVSTDGEVNWKTQLPYYHHHGPAASPVLSNDLLIVNCDGFTRPFYDRLRRPGVTKPQFIVALDRKTGQPRWRQERPRGRHSYATPLLLEGTGPQRAQVICPGGDRVTAYEPQSGRPLWWVTYTGYSVVPRPVAGPPDSGLVYVCTGYDNPRLLAIRTSGTGDVTRTHVAWQLARAVPLNPSPLLVDDSLFLVNDSGICSCLEARTGELRWKRRLGGHFSASPLFVNDHILATNEVGTTHVLVPGKSYRRLALNRIPGRTLATPAVSGNRLLVRTDRELVCIGRQ